MNKHDNNEELNQKYAHLYEAGDTAESSTRRLIEIIRVLRQECPWDREQTHESLKSCLIEEAYEVCDAVDQKDEKHLAEELGDVLLQVVFHAELMEETGSYVYKDIANGVSDKMVRRHPHIFSRENAKSVDKALEKWENVKRRERGSATLSDSMRDIPKSLPALTKSYKIQSKAKSVGFDWDDIKDALSKVTEEKSELETALNEGSKSEIEMELGDLLFSVVNVARFLDIDPEQALNRTSHKFVDRFSYIEREATQRKLNLDNMSLDEMDALWDEAKHFYKNQSPKK